MCGIAGFVGEGSERDLEEMVGCIRHRGPDDVGIFKKGDVGLAHARLSIIDLSSAGHQPMFDEEGTVGVVFNGEIYNFQELRKRLVKKGYAFKSSSDTEVIIHFYKDCGESCFEKLTGMFTIALYDFQKKKLVIARDRMGEKPLYWSLQDGIFVFASELSALMVSGFIKKEIDFAALDKYLLFDFVPTPSTILKQVYKLEPGTILVYEKGAIRTMSFWRPSSLMSAIDEREAVAQLDELLDESIAGQLVSDAPLGIFLSGGIDSSTVAWYASKHSRKTIDTFSIGFTNTHFDESIYAREVAALLGTNHHERVVTPKQALDIIPILPEVFSEPVADASVIPTLLLSAFTKERVKVALGGDGGDELFAGYPTFQAEQLFGVYRHVPGVLKAFGKNILNALPASEKNFSFTFNLRKFISSDKERSEHRHAEWLGSFPEKERMFLVNSKLRDAARNNNALEDIDRYTSEYNQTDSHNRLLYTYLRSYLMDEVMVKVDRASMRYGLEVRAPFLDYRVVEFVFSLPYSLKYKNFQTKYLLKKLMNGRLPNNILHRKKKGFGIPLSGWLKHELKGLCQELLSEEALRRQGLFDAGYVSRLKDEHFLGRVDNRKQLWNLMTFQLWYKKWM